MNEELKIIIKAITEEAEKKLKEVRDELGKIKDEADKADKATEAIKNMGKASAVALTAITALMAGIVNLGKSSIELQKTQGKLISNFEALGSSAETARKAYQKLYGFLGDDGKAVETANLLARMTTNQEELAEWTDILTGAYASFGDSLPVEGLAEASNETAKVGQVTGVLADALNWVGVSEDAFNAQLATLNNESDREAYIRSTLTSIYKNSAIAYRANNAELIAHNESQARLNSVLAETGKYITPLLTAFNNMASTILEVLAPAIKIVVSYLTVLVQWIMSASSAIGAFFNSFKKSKSATKIVEVTGTIRQITTGTNQASKGFNKMNDSLDEAVGTAKELKKQVMGFDELNVVSNPTTSGGVSAGGGAGSNIDIPTFDTSGLGFDTSGIEADLEKVEKKLQGILALVASVGVAILTWKVMDLLTTPALSFGNILKNVGGYALIIAGAVATIWGYTDAFANGVDWGNLLAVVGGLTAVLVGVYMTMGTLALQVGVVGAGFALLVLGVVDFINNGATLQNTILIIGGAIAIAVGLATAGVSVLISVIVGAVVAIGAFITALALEKPAILDVEEAQVKLNEAKEKAVEAENSYINAVDNAEASLKRLQEAEEKAGITGKELFEQVQSGTLDYADMTDTQRELYKAYLDNEQKQKDLKDSTTALTEAKKQEKLASLENEIALGKEKGSYDKCKTSIVEAFNAGTISAQEARDLLSKAMSEMSDDSQKTFMEDLPSNLKNGLDPHKYESTATKLKKWFSNLGSSIKETLGDMGEKVGKAFSTAIAVAITNIITRIVNMVNGFINAINFAIGVINAIPGVNISKLNKLSIPALAKGGIVDSATLALVGERGKEAVLPLENNTSWMDALADKINERNGTPSKIVLMLDGRELGQATINSINDITRQSGRLQLQLI